MQSTLNVRIDKWLWAARIFKTRTLAAEACRRGGVLVGGQRVKPSHEVRLQEIISANNGAITRTVKVLGLNAQRVSASAVKDFLEDLTPPGEYQKRREPSFVPLFFRQKGAGRPTKRERRELDRFLGNARTE